MNTFLETLRTLDAAATPGPWSSKDLGRKLPPLPPPSPSQGPMPMSSSMAYYRLSTDEVRLIAYLRNHATALIGCVEALERLRDCDWVITPADRMDAVRKIARDALAALEGK